MPASKKTILWVDNDVMHIQMYVHALRDAGYEVIVATTVGEARRLISENSRIALAILDVMIPPDMHDQDIDETHAGYEAGMALGRWINEHRPDLPFVGLSILLDKDTVAWFERYGAGYASKVSMRDADDLLEFVNSKLTETRTTKGTTLARKMPEAPANNTIDELQFRLKELEYEYELARMGMIKSRSTMVLVIIGVLFSVATSFFLKWRSDREFLSGTHIVVIVVVVAFTLLIYASFIFGRASRLRATISKTKKEIEMVAGEKVR